MSRRWLRHPPRTIPARTCPSDRPRFSTVALAQDALPASVGDTQLTATPCDRCGGAHHTAR